MIHSRVRTFVMVSCAVLLSGCSSFPGERAPKAKLVGFKHTKNPPGSKHEPKLIGNVAMVNMDGKFVLIACGAWSAPEVGTALKCMRGGVETAVLAAGNERRGIHVAADIASGLPARGDEVYQ
jgi:hypothetical protein